MVNQVNRARIAIGRMAVFSAILVFGLLLATVSRDAHAFVGGGDIDKIVVVKGARSGLCYKTVRERRPFNRFYKSRALYQYHFIDTENCQASTLPPERIPDAIWSILKVENFCYEVLRVPLKATVGIYSPDHTEWEHSWGVQVPCPY